MQTRTDCPWRTQNWSRWHTVARAATIAAALVAAAATSIAVPIASASGATTTTTTPPSGTVVSSETSTYGKVLMAGSGQFAGFTLYQFNRNTPSACTTTPVTVQNMPLACTGTETDKAADWPALTTAAKPVAGPGVDKHMLGMVYRKDLGTDQVTYAGKLLYMFDPKPGAFGGVNYMETVLPLPPWHGVWSLVSPKDGAPVTGAVPVTTQKQSNGSTALAADMFQGQGTIAVIVYSYSKDSKDHSTCTGTCALTWMPVVTSSPPQAGPGVTKSSLGAIRRSDGTEQLTYNGKPLYFYAEEVPQLNPATGNPLDPATIGTGNGMRGPHGGTFSVVAPAAA